MHCHQCGAWLSTTDSFCTVCGAKAPEIMPILENNEHQYKLRTKQLKITHFGKKLIKTGFVLCLLAIVGFYFWNHYATDWKNNFFNANSDLSIKKPEKNGKTSPILEPLKNKVKEIGSALPIGQEKQLEKNCQTAVIDLSKTKQIAFPKDADNKTIIKQQGEKWVLEGTFTQVEKGKRVERNYHCFVEVANPKMGRKTAGIAVVMID